MRNCFRYLGRVFGILAAVLSVGISGVSAQQNNHVVVNFPDFSDISALTLSGSTAGYNNPVNDGVDVLRLTNANFSQAGGAFLTQSISLQNSASFSTYFTFRMSSPGYGGADGLAFVVQRNSNQYGGAGGGIGYYGIDNSLAVEFDTWNNGEMDGHNANHVGISIDGDLNSVARANIGTDMSNGAIWYAWVDYDGANNALEVRLAQNDTRPANPTVSYGVNLSNVLGQDDAYVGFTAATGGAFENHDIRSWFFTNDFAPIEEAPTLATWQNNGHIYEAVAVTGLTWPQANDMANGMSYYDGSGNYWYAHLLTVTSADENSFIVNNFAPQIAAMYFLGGHQISFGNEPAGGWAWVTGEEWSYTNWGANEPNNQYGTEQIIHFWNPQGGWNDHQIYWTGAGGFIVEYEMQDPSAPEISLSTAALDFGNILLSASSDLTFQISNVGDADLNVTDIALTGAGFTTDFGGDFVVTPGNSQDVTVTFTPTAVSNYSATLTITSDDEDEGTLTVSLTGAGVTPEIAVAPISLNYGQVIYSNSSEMSFDVTNIGSADLHYNVAPVNGAGFTLTETTGSYTLIPGASATFNVTFTASGLGSFTGSIGITSDDQTDGNATVSLSGEGIAPDIAVSPISIDFGSILVGSSSSGSFTVSNNGNSDLHYNVPAATGDGFAIVEDAGSYTLGVGASSDFHVTFAPGAFGAASGIVAITSDDPFEGDITVTLAGTGIGPIITINPVSLNFGNVEFWRTATLDFTVANAGTAPGTLASLSGASAPFSVVFSTITLNPGENTTFTVTYTAETLGDFSGTLSLDSDDPFNPTQQISLSGTTIWVTPVELASRLCALVGTYGPEDCQNGCIGDHHGDDEDDDDNHIGDHHGDDDDDDNDHHGHNNNDYVLTCGQVRSLCELLEQAARNLEHHESDHAIRSFEHFIERIERLAGQQEMTAEASATLNAEANFIIALVEAYDPGIIFDHMANQIKTLERNLGRNKNRLNTLKSRFASAERAWEHDQNDRVLTYLDQFSAEASNLAANNTISAAASQSLINDANQIAELIQTYAIAGNRGAVTSASEPIPTDLQISNGYPNPFNSTANLRFSMPEAGQVEITLFDMGGREVRKLVSGQVQAGYHSVMVDGRDLRSGMYLVRMNALGQTQISKVTYIK